MSLRRHGPHLAQFERMRLSNAWFVVDDDGLTLVDTTFAGGADALVAAAAELGAPIRRIVLTHAHNDHFGSLDALARRVPEAEVLVSARDARVLAGEKKNIGGEPADARPVSRMFLEPRPKTRWTRTLEPGDAVGVLEVHAAPGHTPGQIALLDPRDRTLVCGDAYLALGGLFVTTQPVKRFPVPALLGTWNRDVANETAHRLRALEPTRLATGHGPVVEPAVPAMDRALAEAPGA